MAITKACSISNSVGNTGKECDISMVATAMLVAVPRTLTWTLADMEDQDQWLTDLVQEKLAFPLFGQNAPIRTITNNAESDVTVTLDDGLIVFLRYGIYNRVFETTSGGLCYAKSLQSFNKSGYSIIEIDQQGQMLMRKNIVAVGATQTYSGLIMDFMYSPSPVMADFKTTPFKSRFQISYSPIELVTNGVIMEGGSSLLSIMGLIDAEITKAAAATTTILKIGVQTECAESDLVALFTADIDTVSNYIVTNKATGAVVTPSAGAVVSGHVELTGTYVSGQTYNVVGSAPSVWQTNNIEGYDASVNGVDILIP